MCLGLQMISNQGWKKEQTDNSHGLEMRIMKGNEGWKRGMYCKWNKGSIYLHFKKRGDFRSFMCGVCKVACVKVQFFRCLWKHIDRACAQSRFVYSIVHIVKFSNMSTFMHRWKRTQKLYVSGRGLHMGERSFRVHNGSKLRGFLQGVETSKNQITSSIWIQNFENTRKENWGVTVELDTQFSTRYWWVNT